MENSILTLLIFLPVLGAILMLPASKYLKIDNIVKWIAVATTGLQLLLAGWLYMNFDPTVAVMDSPFTVQVDWIKHFNIEYFIGSQPKDKLRNTCWQLLIKASARVLCKEDHCYVES